MTQRETDVARRLRLEFAVLAYWEAWEAGDLDTTQALWRRAETDPELDQALRELGEGLALEQGPAPGWHDDAAKVAGLLQRHLSSSAGPRPVTDPPTARDVVARIASDAALLKKLGPEDRLANTKLLADPTPLPEQLAETPLREWAAALPVRAAESYWKVFRHAALMVTMAHSHRLSQQGDAPAGALLAAARRPAPKGPTDGKHDGKHDGNRNGNDGRPS